MKRRSFFKVIAAGLATSYVPISWCIDRICGNVIYINWMQASWLKSGEGPVTFEARWKYPWSKTWKQVHADVERNPSGPTELPLTPKHAISADTHAEPVWEL